jgi:hypothetical protein
MKDQDRILVGGILLREHRLDKIARLLKQDCPDAAVLDIVDEWQNPNHRLNDPSQSTR